jgi:type III pantothenate kinase
MNLIIDIGNTSTKLAWFEGREKLSLSRINELTAEVLKRELSDHKIENAIISSVKELPENTGQLLSASVTNVHILSYKSKLPFSLDYETPETLGADRIAAVAGAFSLFPLSEVLIIDAGTAITYDYLSGSVYKGGNISPGLNMRFMALNKFTGKLPLISPADQFTLPGRNTTDAILAGVITGVTYEINEYIRTFEKNNINVKILLTGGDSRYLKDRISYQYTFMPDIVIDGLNYILEYNG